MANALASVPARTGPASLASIDITRVSASYVAVTRDARSRGFAPPPTSWAAAWATGVDVTSVGSVFAVTAVPPWSPPLWTDASWTVAVAWYVVTCRLRYITAAAMTITTAASTYHLPSHTVRRNSRTVTRSLAFWSLSTSPRGPVYPS